MFQENCVLRLIFPPKYWEGNKDEYDFIGNYPMIVKILKAYLNGQDIENYQTEEGKKGLDSQKDMGEAVINMLVKNGFENIIMSSDERSKMWANSIVEFFKFGIKLQTDKKKPYPEISW
jgi:hypothetical protein